MFIDDKGVLLPYEITLLSNAQVNERNAEEVLLPYEITLLSNQSNIGLTIVDVLLPYEITLLSNSKAKTNAREFGFTTL